MLSENLKRIRKDRGFTQEELAIRLHVVRQTVSKWEKGLSVPDAEQLLELSRVLEVPVAALLGAAEETEESRNAVAEQLARINEQLAVRNRRARRIWTAVAVAVGVLLLLPILSAVLFRAAPGHAMAESITLADDSVYTAPEIEEAFDAVQRYFKQSLKGCEPDTLSYEETAPARPDAPIAVTARFHSGAHPKAEGIEPNRTFTAVFTLSRGTGRWLVEDWTLQTGG